VHHDYETLYLSLKALSDSSLESFSGNDAVKQTLDSLCSGVCFPQFTEILSLHAD
jgi:hypothetical protein